MDRIKKAIRKIRQGFLKTVLYEIGWIYQLLTEYRKDIILCTIMVIFVPLIGLWITSFSQTLVDGLINKDWDSIKRLAILFLIVGPANVCISMVSQRLAGKVNAKVRTQLAARAYNSIMYADWETVIDHHSGDLMTRIQEDVTTIAGSTVSWIPSLMSLMLQTVIAFAVILYIDYSLVLMVIIVAPVLLVGSRIFLGKLYESNQAQRKINSEIMSDYKESFQHIQSIKSFGLLEQFCSNMAEKQEKRQTIDLRANKYTVASWGVMYMAGQLAGVVCVFWTVYRVGSGALSIGSMTMLLLFGVKVAGNFKTLIDLIPSVMGTLVSSERLRMILELPKESLENEEAYDQMLMDSKDGISLSFQDMNFSYKNGKKVFEHVNCQINDGEIVAFVGPSGEGKTTILRILLGIIHAQGNCMINTKNCSLPISTASRKLMAYVPQGNTMLKGTIAENLRMLRPDASDDDIIQALKEACAWEFVEKLPNNIYYNIGESGIGFSEGQNQRLAIARALMCDTPLLLLDEATSALDVATERKVLANLMRSVNRRTCILTTHRPSVLSMCDRVYRIADQNIHEIGESQIRQIMNDF